jgi:hypothetical protein
LLHRIDTAIEIHEFAFDFGVRHMPSRDWRDREGQGTFPAPRARGDDDAIVGEGMQEGRCGRQEKMDRCGLLCPFDRLGPRVLSNRT